MMAHASCQETPMTSSAARTPLRFAVDIPFVEALGFKLWRVEAGVAEIGLDVQPEQLNSWQVAHGGVLMTLLDVAMAQAARSVRESDPDGAPGLATIEMKTSFVRAAEGRLLATGTLLHATPKMAFCEGAVRDATGALCAHATGTFKYVRALRRTHAGAPAAGTDPGAAGHGSD
jgi:uncharacterized protein (TIGR00369 family)